MGVCGRNSSGSGQVQMAGFYEHCNEPSGSLKGEESLRFLSGC